VKKTLLITFSILIALAALAAMIAKGYTNMVQVLSHVQMSHLILALLASGATYFFMGLSLWEVLKLLGHRINIGAAVSIAFVSTTVNYFVSSMGVSGFALRAHLLRKRNVPFAASVTASVVISVLLYAIMAFLALLGCFFLVLHSKGTRFQLLEGIVGIVALLGLCFFIGMGFFDHEMRSKWMHKIFVGINHLTFFFSGGFIPRENFLRFEKQLEHGINIIHQNKFKLTGAIAFSCLDWICTLLVLDLGFRAVGVSVPIGLLIAGFALGMITTLIPILPGGLGAMELAMTAAYATFGIPWHSALVACLIYRLAYYIIPAVLSFFVYWGLKMSEPLDLAEEQEEIRRIMQEDDNA